MTLQGCRGLRQGYRGLPRCLRLLGCMTVSAGRFFAPEGRWVVATGGVRRSRTQPVVSGRKNGPAPGGAEASHWTGIPPPLPGRGSWGVRFHGLRSARLTASGAPLVATILGPSGTVFSRRFCHAPLLGWVHEKNGGMRRRSSEPRAQALGRPQRKVLPSLRPVFRQRFDSETGQSLEQTAMASRTIIVATPISIQRLATHRQKPCPEQTGLCTTS